MADYTWYVSGGEQRLRSLIANGHKLSTRSGQSAAGSNDLYWRTTITSRYGLIGKLILACALVSLTLAGTVFACVRPFTWFYVFESVDETAVAVIIAILGWLGMIGASAWLGFIGVGVLFTVIARYRQTMRTGCIEWVQAPESVGYQVPVVDSCSNVVVVGVFKLNQLLQASKFQAFEVPELGHAIKQHALSSLPHTPHLLWGRFEYRQLRREADACSGLLMQAAASAKLTRLLQTIWIREYDAMRLDNAIIPAQRILSTASMLERDQLVSFQAKPLLGIDTKLTQGLHTSPLVITTANVFASPSYAIKAVQPAHVWVPLTARYEPNTR